MGRSHTWKRRWPCGHRGRERSDAATRQGCQWTPELEEPGMESSLEHPRDGPAETVTANQVVLTVGSWPAELRENRFQGSEATPKVCGNGPCGDRKPTRGSSFTLRDQPPSACTLPSVPPLPDSLSRGRITVGEQRRAGWLCVERIEEEVIHIAQNIL